MNGAFSGFGRVEKTSATEKAPIFLFRDVKNDAHGRSYKRKNEVKKRIFAKKSYGFLHK